MSKNPKIKQKCHDKGYVWIHWVCHIRRTVDSPRLRVGYNGEDQNIDFLKIYIYVVVTCFKTYHSIKTFLRHLVI